jgi:hypothetical protein
MDKSISFSMPAASFSLTPLKHEQCSLFLSGLSGNLFPSARFTQNSLQCAIHLHICVFLILRHYIDSKDAALAQSILDNVAAINQVLAQKVNRSGDTFTGPVYLLNASTEPNAPVTHAMLDDRVNQLLNNAPAALDTLGEIADFIENNADAIGTLTSTKLDRTGDTAHGLSNDGWFTSLNNTGWRTSHGSGFLQTSPLRLEVFGPALLSAEKR